MTRTGTGSRPFRDLPLLSQALIVVVTVVTVAVVGLGGAWVTGKLMHAAIDAWSTEPCR